MIDDCQLESLYDEFAQRLYGYLLTFTRRDADANDLLQDLFVKLARNPDCLNGVASERAFLFRIAHNLAIDWSRRARSRRERVDQLAAEYREDPIHKPAADPDQEIFRQHLDSALAHVTGDYMGEHWLASFALLTLLAPDGSVQTTTCA